MTESDPPYVRRRREHERGRTEAARTKLERSLVWIEVVTALGIWATVMATAIAILDARRSNGKQIEALTTQQTLMKGQLDTMIAQQRPWVSAEPQLDLPLLRDVTANRNPDLSVPITVELRNHGGSPATNVIIYSMIVPAFATHDAEALNQGQETLCAEAEQASKDSNRIGISIFPGEQKSGSAIAGISYPRNTVLPPLVMQGCIEYSYNSGRHGETGYRMYLGHINADTRLWEGFTWRTDLQRTLPEAGVLLEMKPKGIDFRETDDGGNWAR